jgi:predicted nucleic acid-binding protein
MALSHLADTSVLSRLRFAEVRAVIEPLALHGQIARAGISDLEVGFSRSNASEWDRLVGALSVFELVETTSEHVRRARQVQRLLAQHHMKGRKIPHLLVAAAAEEQDLLLLHYDADFDLIAKVTCQRCQWVVPAGGID